MGRGLLSCDDGSDSASFAELQQPIGRTVVIRILLVP